jgi:hypothetical protein
MSRGTLEERVAALERQVAALFANHAGSGRVKDWRRTRGALTGDELMKQVFEEGRKIREAERRRAQSKSGKKRQAHSSACSTPITFLFSPMSATRGMRCCMGEWKRQPTKSLARL